MDSTSIDSEGYSTLATKDQLMHIIGTQEYVHERLTTENVKYSILATLNPPDSSATHCLRVGLPEGIKPDGLKMHIMPLTFNLFMDGTAVDNDRQYKIMTGIEGHHHAIVLLYLQKGPVLCGDLNGKLDDNEYLLCINIVRGMMMHCSCMGKGCEKKATQNILVPALPPPLPSGLPNPNAYILWMSMFTVCDNVECSKYVNSRIALKNLSRIK